MSKVRWPLWLMLSWKISGFVSFVIIAKPVVKPISIPLPSGPKKSIPTKIGTRADLSKLAW